MKKPSVLGIDMAKQVFPPVRLDAHGTIVVCKQLYRAQVMWFIAQLPPRRVLAWRPVAAPIIGRAAFGNMAMRSS